MDAGGDDDDDADDAMLPLYTQIPDIFVLLDDSSVPLHFIFHLQPTIHSAAALRSNKSIILQLFFLFLSFFLHCWQ